MAIDLLTGRAWVKRCGVPVTLRLIERDGEWEWQDPGGNIVAEGSSRLRALGALLDACGLPEFGLVFEVEALAPKEPKPQPAWVD